MSSDDYDTGWAWMVLLGKLLLFVFSRLAKVGEQLALFVRDFF